MGNSDHGTIHVRAGGDDGELRPWHFIYEGRRGRWGTPTMALHIRMLPSSPARERHGANARGAPGRDCHLVESLGVRVQNLGLRVQGSGFRVQGSGFRV